MASVQMSSSHKKLLVLDVNGLLVDTYFYTDPRPEGSPAAKIGSFYVYKRPFCDQFVQFCLENFLVGIWSSAREQKVNNMINFVFGALKSKLAFSWHQSDCTDTGLKAPENESKPLFLKELSKLWERSKSSLPWNKGQYGPTNTLLVDDTPYKALRNPPNTAIFPQPYSAYDAGDDILGGALRVYLEGLRDAANVQQYVKNKPFGQPSITTSDPFWSLFSQILAIDTSTEIDEKSCVEAVNDVSKIPAEEARGKLQFTNNKNLNSNSIFTTLTKKGLEVGVVVGNNEESNLLQNVGLEQWTCEQDQLQGVRSKLHSNSLAVRSMNEGVESYSYPQHHDYYAEKRKMYQTRYEPGHKGWSYEQKKYDERHEQLYNTTTPYDVSRHFCLTKYYHPGVHHGSSTGGEFPERWPSEVMDKFLDRFSSKEHFDQNSTRSGSGHRDRGSARQSHILNTHRTLQRSFWHDEDEKFVHGDLSGTRKRNRPRSRETISKP